MLFWFLTNTRVQNVSIITHEFRKKKQIFLIKIEVMNSNTLLFP